MADEMNSTCTDRAQDQTEQAVPDADTARMADTMAEDATAEDATAEGATEADTACDAQAGAADDADENGKLRGSERRRLKRAEAELAEANKKLEQAKQELATERDKYLRMLAEYDNFRRRTAKEKEGIYTDACADAVRELLPIVDTLERAVADIPPEKQDDPVAKGVRMTLKAAADALRKLDVTEVETVKFDPNLHNAVMHVEDDTKGEGEIVDVFQKGYRRGDKVIRFAMVRVAN